VFPDGPEFRHLARFWWLDESARVAPQRREQLLLARSQGKTDPAPESGPFDLVLPPQPAGSITLITDERVVRLCRPLSPTRSPSGV